MNPHDWNSYLAGEAAAEEMGRQLAGEAEHMLAVSAESGFWQIPYRHLIMCRILEVSTDPRPGHD